MRHDNFCLLMQPNTMFISEKKILSEVTILSYKVFDPNYIDLLIDWCLTQNLAIFQLYRGVSKFYKIISTPNYNFIHIVNPCYVKEIDCFI